MRFKGNIIITDPCYIINDENDDDWELCDYGRDLDQLGLSTYICRDTIYGDWSCTVFNTDTDREIGKFCADAGMVAVFLLDEVLQYNPKFNYHIDKPWTTTLIKNFEGDVSIDVVGEEVFVVGKGNINFKSTQTGL
jgi:hypothetical protein